MATVEPWIHAFIHAAALALELAAAVLVTLAAGRALVELAWRLLRRREEDRAYLEIRHRFGRSLLLGLDFAVGSDLLQLAIAPSLTAAATAGLVVLARGALTLLLEHELRGDERTRRRDRLA